MCILFLNVSDNKTARTLHNRCNDNISNNVAKFVIMVFMLQVEDFCESPVNKPIPCHNKV